MVQLVKLTKTRVTGDDVTSESRVPSGDSNLGILISVHYTVSQSSRGFQVGALTTELIEKRTP
jgi:hypothetical protein